MKIDNRTVLYYENAGGGKTYYYIENNNNVGGGISYYYATENGNLIFHRMVGPAITYANGDPEWFYHGQKIYCKSQEEFERIIKLKAFW